MKTIRHLTPILFTLCLLLAACSGNSISVQASSSPTVRPSPSPQAAPINPQGTPTQPTGDPAITPTGTGTPPLTSADVQAYFMRFPTLPYAQASGSFAVAQITFESSRAVQAVLNGTKTGFSDSAILCLVLVTGQFAFSAPPGATARYQQGFVVFAAQTGNLIMSGGLHSQAPARLTTHALTSAAAVTRPSSPMTNPPHKSSAERPNTANSYNCPNSSHCYAVASWSSANLHTNQLAGLSVDISYTDLSAGDGFLDNEAWLIQANNPQCGDGLADISGFCWIELGMVASAVPIGSSSVAAGTQYFWAELAPNGPFVFHDLGAVPAADKNPQTPDGFFISYDGTATWQVAIVGATTGSTLFFAYSQNSMTPDTVDMGQELFGTNGAGSAGSADYRLLNYYDGYVIHIGGTYIHESPGSPPDSSNPPFFTWIIPPSPTTFAPEFQTHCC